MSTLTIDITRADSSSVDAQLLLGIKGDTGAAAGFGAVTASVDANIGTPSVVVTTSGADTAKDFDFAFHNLKGEKGEAGDVEDVQYDGVSRVDTAVASIPIVNFYGECITARATITKSLNIYGFELLNGVVVAIRFTYGNESIRSININSTGAKYITYKGETTTASTSLILDELRLTNSTGVFLYDGTNYVFIGCVYNVATDQSRGLMSSGDKSKLGGIEAGAEVNVQSDWTEADSTSDAYIKNKPTTRHLWFGVCTDGYSTTEKTVATESGDFELVAGNAVCVQFTAGHSAVTMKLAVDGTTSKYVRPTDNTTDMSTRIAQGEIAMFVYTGTTFLMVEGGKASTSRYGQTKLSTSVSSTSTELAATPSAVKQAYDLANGKADAVHTHEVADITDFPTIPTVNDATLTIQQNGTDVVTFTANSATDATADITVPTDVSDLNDDIGIATLDDLSTLLPTDTASGAIASFLDGQSIIPALSVIADIEPIQDLHGYDKPWSGGAGKNKMPQPTISLGGTNPRTANIYFDTPLPIGTYICSWQVSGTYTGTAQDAGIGAYASDNSSSGAINKTTGTFVTTKDTTRLYFYMPQTNYDNGETLIYSNFQIEQGSTATSYEPYSNICPISGRTECVTRVCGVNVWDEEWELGGINNQTGGTYGANDRIRSKNFVPCLPNTEYYWKCPSSLATIACYDSSENFVSAIANVQGDKARTTPANAHYVKFGLASTYGTTYNNDISINYPSTDHEYHAYQGDSYTTDLGRTVYGGTLDVVSGELNVTMGYIASYNGETIGEPWISDRDEYVAGTTPSIGAEVAYTLATPQTYQLTPTEVSLLLGQNNVWCDSGEVEVTYKADVGLYIDKKLNA